jgi:hypothetical protein
MNGEGFIEAAAGGRGGAYVGLDGHAHAQLADQQGECGAHDEGDGAADGHDHAGRTQAEFCNRLPAGGDNVNAEEEDDSQEADGRQDGFQLPVQVAVGANADGVPHLLHLLRPLVLFQDDAAQEPGVEQADKGREQYAHDGKLLEIREPMPG